MHSYNVSGTADVNNALGNDVNSNPADIQHWSVATGVKPEKSIESIRRNGWRRVIIGSGCTYKGIVFDLFRNSCAQLPLIQCSFSMETISS